MFSKIHGVSVPYIRRTTVFFLLLLFSSVSAPALAAMTDIGHVPDLIEEYDHSATIEIDVSGLRDSGLDVMPDERPSHDAPMVERSRIQAPNILAVSVEGNSEVMAGYILSVITSREGSPLDQNRLARDADAIFEQGFYSNVDYRIIDEPDGVRITFIVTENPIIDDIRFFGNTIYSEDVLKDLCFTEPGMIFNRVFFRNDLQRIREKYQQDGYVMARVEDVRIDGAVVNVYLLEPMVGNIVIQGNRRTKTHVIERQLRIKGGDFFNATRLRYSLSRLQGLGYFSDVSVGFEQGEYPDIIDLILTVTEARTGRLGISVGYGTQSGFSGGISYGDDNFRGMGERLSVGFDLGSRRQYWLTLEQPYMDPKVFAWRAGAYHRTWDELNYYEDGESLFKYNEERFGGYLGFGRKFSESSKLSWFLTGEWQKINLNVVDGGEPTKEQLERLESGTNLTLSGRLTRDNMDEFSDFPKGDVESINVEKGLEGLGGNWNYWKYWIEARYYTPLDFLRRMFERNFAVEDVPPIFAMRVMAGDSSGYLPWAVDYTLGGDSTLRGYEERRFRGDQMFLANAEVRIPFVSAASLVFFYDAGMVWDTRLSERFNFNDLAEGYGVGFRVRTPLGNLRLDFAQGKDESRVHFGFGEMF